MCWCVAKWEKRRHELDDRLALSVVVDDMTRRNNVSVRRSSARMHRKKNTTRHHGEKKKCWTSNCEPIHQADFMPMKHSIWMTSIRLICRLSKVDALAIDIAQKNNRSPAARRWRIRSAKKATLCSRRQPERKMQTHQPDDEISRMWILIRKSHFGECARTTVFVKENYFCGTK